jgi:hypothetical protein
MKVRGLSVAVLFAMPAVLLITTAVATAGSATSTSATGETAPAPLVGTWRRRTTCTELVAVLTAAGIPRSRVLEAVAGNGFVPGVTSPDQIADPAKPCVGAVPRVHSHFFTRGGAFGSLDWNGDPVDDGRYRIVRPGTFVIFKEFPKVTFHYRIQGKTIRFTPVVAKGCASFRCAWAVSVAYPGKTWQRVR